MGDLEPRKATKIEQGELQSFQANIERLERRDSWLWATVFMVMLLLTVALFIFALPAIFKGYDPLGQISLQTSVRGLLGVVVLFDIYALYQQFLIKRLRKELNHKLYILATLEIDAEEYYKQAVLDPLTTLYNRRFAAERLEVEVARAQRFGHPLLVLMIDMNDFKPINDKYGHAAGDVVLKEFAHNLKKAIRASDLPVRMGGDEFMVLLPECPPAQVALILGRLREFDVEVPGGTVHAKFSCGWTQYQAGETPHQFVERADQELYEIKRRSKGKMASTRGAT
jgi:diguanylate cyclase (GGDEF)-like protein